ncbi:2-oxoglutarate (2OG) and Fe(II)-dependent oxygenase superfamily protein [Abeliophyllum distichum]|uniref:2-oxoglutarate (2OG) and Fe(II)-dependent oxygenase superfamily protein n=1 Tax=Abeliophyllum distichum TaxID=126358 RepID=A0ABD1PPM4_9LAMI
MARSLCLEEDYFLRKLGERKLIYARFNYYPPCPRPDLALGIKPHADGSAITFLLQDKEVEGLQVVKDDNWFHVHIIPYALLVIKWRGGFTIWRDSASVCAGILQKRVTEF